MNRGAVVFWKGFSFDDGVRSDRLLVVVGSGLDGRLLMLRTTSQASARCPDLDGCYPDASVFRFKQHLGGFKNPTSIQFDPPIIRTPQQVVDGAQNPRFLRSLERWWSIVMSSPCPRCEVSMRSLIAAVVVAVLATWRGWR